MYKIIPAVLIMIMTFSACQSSEEEQTDEVSTTPPPVTAPVTVPDSMQTVLPMTTPPAVTPAGPVAKLNPPHGQPGHRCDIEVGQPLPAGGGPAAGSTTIAAPPPVQTQVPVMQNPQPVMATPPPANLLPNTAKGPVNPPHGQPGHRCDIAVGAPLN